MGRRLALLGLSAALASLALPGAIAFGGSPAGEARSPGTGSVPTQPPEIFAPPRALPAKAAPKAGAVVGAPYPMKAGERFTWSKYRPAHGSGLYPLSGTAETAFREAQVGAAGAVPAGVIPALPASFAPNVLVNQDLSSAPHNETAVAINPKNPNNIVAGANDYRLGFGSSGFYATLDGGRTWQDGIIPFPTVWFEPAKAAGSTTGRQLLALDGGGDPAIAFDHDGTAYYADIQFHRQGCASMILVSRSINGGLTWNRPLWGKPSPGDPRTNGDGVVAINDDDSDCTHFYDKEFIAAGPRPKDASLVDGTDPEHVTKDRVYVTFTDFVLTPVAGTNYIMSPIMVSYSDDQGRHWSRPAPISGASSELCTGSLGQCVENQGSVPAVDPRTGAVHVYFFNADTRDNIVAQELNVQVTTCPAPAAGVPCTQIPDQLLVVSSTDGGASWAPPSRAAMLVDDNMPIAGESLTPDPLGDEVRCPAQSAGRAVLGETCFRWGPFGNITIDPRNGRLYVVWSDNRNGTSSTLTGSPLPVSITLQKSDVDVFVAASSDGTTWSEPKRVNRDPLSNTRDQFYPWAAVGPDGTLYVSFLDRAQDPKNHDIGTTVCASRDDSKSFTCSALSTGLWDPDLSFRAGLFIGDYTGIAAGPKGAFAVWPDARRGRAARNGDNPPPLFSDAVGGYAPGASSPAVLGTRIGRPPAAPKPAPALPATGVAHRRAAWALLAAAALLAAVALSPRRRRV
jgi:hypothetical protein